MSNFEQSDRSSNPIPTKSDRLKIPPHNNSDRRFPLHLQKTIASSNFISTKRNRASSEKVIVVT
jgi:hypothetical protein